VDTKTLRILVDLADIGAQEAPWGWSSHFKWSAEECEAAVNAASNELRIRDMPDAMSDCGG